MGRTLERDEFSEAVRTALAKRASYVCSNPDCRALTIAPADVDAMKVLFIGKVAHICAAASGGPRYDSGMSAEHRRAIENALFLCSNCADMIDKNSGTDFSKETLLRWKAEHEIWVRSNLNRRPDSPLSIVSGRHEAHGQGEVTALFIEGSAIISAGTVVKATGQGIVTGTRIGAARKR